MSAPSLLVHVEPGDTARLDVDAARAYVAGHLRTHLSSEAHGVRVCWPCLTPAQSRELASSLSECAETILRVLNDLEGRAE